jgi:serine/threonine protein phosphatase 1
MYYIIGDIHGYLEKLLNLMGVLREHFQKDDTFLFLGDYIDRGSYSFEVIEFLISLSKKSNTIFLTGNHEMMLKKYLAGEDSQGMFLYNGGKATINSYKRNTNSFKLPHSHDLFFKKLRYYFEGEDFVAVHAGLNPDIDDIQDQADWDMVWIREKFYNSPRAWKKTVIFGHTPTMLLKTSGLIYFDDNKNIIGIDSGVIFGRELSCLRWPDRRVFSSEF